MAGGVVNAATVAHKQAVRQWVADLAARAGAAQPQALARALTVLLDGGLSAGALEPSPDVAVQARDAARTLVDAACANRHQPAPTVVHN